MRTNLRTPAPAPGFAEHRTASRIELLLPTNVVWELREEKRRREEALDEVLAAERRQREIAHATAVAAVGLDNDEEIKARKQQLAQGPKAGFYRVLPDFDQLIDRDLNGESTGRTADKDVNERSSRIVEKLIELGPDRRVAKPADWRRAFDELEQSMPNFKAPIRSIRNALALADASNLPPRIAPILLLGPPGVGKTRFSHQLASLLGASHRAIAFDQPSAGTDLRGSDKYWANSEPGCLFNMIALGDCANPVILLDELDKSVGSGGRQDLDPLAQLHGAMEQETAQRMVDISVDMVFDASLATYIATANSTHGLGEPLLSRMEVFDIPPPSRDESIAIARRVAEQSLRKRGLHGRVSIEQRAVVLLGHLVPRRMMLALESALAAAIESGANVITEKAVWADLEQAEDNSLRVH